jgi:trimeric autotransporter adhesin
MTMKASKLFFVLRILLFLSFGFFLQAIHSYAVSGDEHWDARFGAPGTMNNILAMAVNNGMLCVGGYGTPSTNATLSVWDGNQWSALGTFNNGTSPAYIYDASFVGNTLYVAGMFTSVNGTAASGLARWDGNIWSNIGFSGSGLALAESGSDLYVGGIFTNLDGFGVVMTNIGSWDGSAWHALGGGLGGPSDFSNVRTMIVNGGLVYAGGSFTNSGAQVITNLAVWNGSIWSAVGGGANGIVYSLAVNGSTLYAGGGFTQAGSTTAYYIAEWDGSTWYALGSGLSGSVNNLVIFNNQICAVGNFTSAGDVPATNFAVWNGSSWSAAGNGLSAAGTRVISNGTNVYVGGSFTIAGSSFVNGVASWDGTNWSGIGTPGRINGLQSTSYAVADDGNNLYAGGLFTYAGQTNASQIARFDGTNWYPLGSGISTNGGQTIVHAIAVSSNNVYVGGSFSTAGGVSALNIARWDGTNWYALGNGPGGVVASITVRTDGVYAAGAPQSNVTLTYGSPFFERWDGTNWLNMINFNATNTIDSFYLNDPNIGMDAVAFLGTNIYIGGHFEISWHDPTFTFGTNCYNIMRFDGTYDQIVGTGLNSNVVAMAVLATNLYVAGLFTNAGGITASHIAMWDGNNWFTVGGGVVGSGTVSSLATIGNNLYAGGTFTNIGGVSAARIAKWDGTNWSALGSGVVFLGTSGSVLGMAAFGSDLYVGGGFYFAGGKQSYFLGHWNDQINFNIPQLVNPAWLGNGQFHMKLYGISGLTNIIQATTNFSSWVPVLTNTVGIYNFTDASASHYPYRFYRATLGH